MDRLQQINDLRRALNELRLRNESFKRNFSIFVELIDEGKFVTSENLTNLGDEFFGWMNNEGYCLKLYHQIFDEYAPESLAEVEERLDAEEKKIRESSIFYQAERFLDLVTEDRELGKILIEYQKKLQKLLERKRHGPRFQTQLEPYAKFVKAVREEDFGKKYSASVEFREFFGDDFIGRGLFKGELILQSDEKLTVKPAEVPIAETSAKVIKKTSGRRAAKTPDKVADKVVDKVTDKKPAKIPDEVTSEPEKVEDSDFVKTINGKGALLTAADFAQWEKVFVLEKNDRDKDFSASRFKRDFKNSEILKPVLSYAATHGIVASSALCPTKMPPEILDNISTLLLSRGYLQKYSVGNLAEFYGLTKNFFDFIKSDSGKKFVVTKQSDKNKIDNATFMEFDAKSALTRAICLRLYNIEAAQGNNFFDLEFFKQAFRAEFDGNVGRDLFIGCFWDKPDECDKFLKRLKNYFKKNKLFKRIFVVGLTLEQSAKIFDALEEGLPMFFPKDNEQYLCAFNDNAFYRRDTREKISAADIWASPMHDPDDPEKNSDALDDSADIDADKKSEAAPENSTSAAEILRPVKGLLLDKKFYCATAYLKAQISPPAEVEHVYRQLSFALDDPFRTEGYSATIISTLAAKDDTEFNEALVTAAAMRALFYNDFGSDFGVPALHAMITGFELVKSNAPLSAFIDDLKNFKTTVMKGVDFYADYQSKDKVAAEKNLDQIVHDAQEYYTHFFEGQLRDKADNETFIRMKKIIFDRNGDFAQIFRSMTDRAEAKSADTLQLVKEFLTENFLDKNANVDAVNLDGEKLAQFIDDKWDEASDKKNPGRLISKLRNNITKNMERAVEIMCAWVNCAEIFSAAGEDDGSIEYKKIRGRLLTNISEACRNFAAKFRTRTIEAAGISVVDYTLKEFSARLNGNYVPFARKYFYVDFLRSDKVILDENYLPKLDLNVVDGKRERVPDQILAHAAIKLQSFQDRIEQIFELGGDDFGSAQLIDDYSKKIFGVSIIERKEYDFQKCMNSAAKDAPRYRESFIGGLELAQSYGHFDGAEDGEKERILQLAENCYKYAEQSKNFGVFFRVKKYWENVIKKNADKLCEWLRWKLQLATKLYRDSVENFDPSALNESVAEIEKIINSRNCTVAHSLILRLAEGELYQKFDDVEETVLSRFIADYADCYNKVSDSGYSLENLIGKKIFTHDKVSRAKLNLIKNWITNPVAEDRIKTLLELLGFDVEVVQKISTPANAITFNVKILKSEQTKYYHPIAAFGSDAEVDGFRVSCLFGKYDEKNLLGKFKELGNGKHTLVFLDYSLDLPTRRRLAKEIKLDKSLTKVFALVDRVTIMYLIKNCAAQISSKRINDTLMSLIMPFARYQPYISSPRIPLPPEMFIGREAEITEVTNQNGVNIVCGGRQLGKSALLKMACRKVDGHDNERAIYLEITDKNYREAALLTSRELSDRKFFNEPFETDDWEELARAIKNRLLSDTPAKISYFLLMLDEADEFIESCAAEKYSPIVALAKIQQESYNGSRFKFIIAGLRNIIRFEREKIFSDNIILPTLKSLTVKPFGLEDARKLLEVPLRYLGLYFPDGKKDSLILTILETANYYPSLIQLYCEKLLTALFETSYAGYNADTPVYEISEDHIKKVLADKEFTEDIKTKIEITLGLGRDDYYHAIANLLAYLYYTQNDLGGYSPQDILKAAEEFGLVEREILPASAEKIAALMEELCELNIMRKNGEASYLFSRQRILRIIGSLPEVENALLKLMTE